MGAYLSSKGLPIELFGRVKLWALWVTLGQIDYLSEMMKRPALRLLPAVKLSRAVSTSI